MRPIRWSLLVGVATLVAACSSGPVEVVAPEPPPVVEVTEPPPAQPQAVGDPAAVAVAPPVAVDVAPPAAPVAPAAEAVAEDDPVLEGPTRGPAVARPARAAAPARPGAVQAAAAKPSGKPAATGRIEIPAIGLNHATYEGIDLATINHGPSHWPGTAAPGQRGNTVFPGHRTTYSRPFWDLDKLAPGHDVIFTTPAGRFTYKVTHTLIVSSTDTYVVNPTPDATFTIIACHPKGSARQRIVVKGNLVSAPPPPPPPPPAPAAPPTTRAKFLGIL